MRNHGTDPKTRGRRADEQLAAMRKIWTEDEAEFHGEFVDFDPVWAWPKPVQQPHPPIYIGGGDSKAVFDRIVKAGAGWFPNGGPDPSVLKAQITALREHAGREVPITAGSATISPEALDAYAEWGTVERALLFLPTMPAAETEKWLDEYADFVPRYA
jgi:alkanesulfonate monooxygenase SsuD/methylene tetrahydromethanopterin reductase-like flavin-dependent oxidoreductase (luciferase family)